MKYGKMENGSYLHNCYIEKREGDSHLFMSDENIGAASCFLNGYAVIPMEKYMELLGKEFDDTDIKEAAKQLNQIDEDGEE